MFYYLTSIFRIFLAPPPPPHCKLSSIPPLPSFLKWKCPYWYFYIKSLAHITFSGKERSKDGDQEVGYLGVSKGESYTVDLLGNTMV